MINVFPLLDRLSEERKGEGEEGNEQIINPLTKEEKDVLLEDLKGLSEDDQELVFILIVIYWYHENASQVVEKIGKEKNEILTKARKLLFEKEEHDKLILEQENDGFEIDYNVSNSFLENEKRDNRKQKKEKKQKEEKGGEGAINEKRKEREEVVTKKLKKVISLLGFPYSCECPEDGMYIFDFDQFPEDLLRILDKFRKLNQKNALESKIKQESEEEKRIIHNLIGNQNRQSRLDKLKEERERDREERRRTRDNRFVNELSSFLPISSNKKKNKK